MIRITGRAPSLVATLVAGTAVGIPGTLGVLLGSQIRRARRNGPSPRPDYEVDVTVDAPWAQGEPLHVAFLGDSLVEGVGAPLPGQSLPAQTAYRLAAHLGRSVRVEGFGIASSRIADVIEDQVPHLREEHDLVLVLIGANDATGRTPPWEFGRAVEELAEQAAARTGGAPVVFTGLPDLRAAPLLARPLKDVAGAWAEALHGVQRRTAMRHRAARWIDVRVEVSAAVRRAGHQLFSEDRYHPNPAGYALLGEGIARSLTALLALEAEQAADDVAARDRAAPAFEGRDEAAPAA